MIPQERKYTLDEVHTNIGIMGEIRFDEAFMEVLGVKPGDRISFFVDREGTVTVKAWKQEQTGSAHSIHPETPRPGEVTQAALFPEGVAPPTRRRNPPMRR